MKLAAKITTILLGAVFLCVILAEYIMLQHEQSQFARDARLDAQQLCSTIAQIVEDVWDAGGETRAMQVVRKINALNRPMTVRIVDLAATGTADAPTISPDQLNARQDIPVFQQPSDGNATLLLAYAKLAVDRKQLALELRATSVSTGSEAEFVVYHGVALMASTALLGIILAVMIGTLWIGKPLRILVDKTRRIGSGDLSAPLNLRRRDEFGELGLALDDMCAALQSAQQQIHNEAAARIAATEQLRHADRLRTVGRIAAGIAHELGTPLNVISGRAGLIRTGKLNDTDVDQCAGIIKDEADRIASMIRQLLDFARRSAPRRQPTDLVGIANQTHELLLAFADRNHVQLAVTATLPACVALVDGPQIQQVLSNLVVNAIEAMPHGGEVELSVRTTAPARRDADPQAASEFACIDVRDQGDGIAAEVRDHIFEPFFTTKQTGDGTGLGLAIADGIIREHGGRIDVTSTPGQGSCFTVVLPMENSTCQEPS